MLEVGDNISISIMFMIGCVQSYTSIQTKIIDYQNVTNISNFQLIGWKLS